MLEQAEVVTWLSTDGHVMLGEATPKYWCYVSLLIPFYPEVLKIGSSLQMRHRIIEFPLYVLKWQSLPFI